jgi:hypothetical protein
MPPITKDSAYHFRKLTTGVKARIPGIIFRFWDPLTAWLDATAKRVAELSADIVQTGNDFYIDSAKGAKLDRRLGANEGVPRLLAKPADDGTVVLRRQTPPAVAVTFPVGSISVAPVPDPSKPSADRPVYTNAQELTIAPGATTWTIPFKANRGGADTNMPADTPLQLVTQASQLDTAAVATPFTTGTDDERDEAYRQRGKLVIRSRTLGTDDALVAAALTAGAYFAYTTEDFTPGAPPVTLYAADANGQLSAGLRAEILRHINGDPGANPPIPMARAKGIWVDVQPAASVVFNFSIKLILQSWVTGAALDQLHEDLEEAITAYVRSLNIAGTVDRTMRINRIKEICLTFRGRGVVDVDDATFLPATSTTLTSQQMATMGTLTWL